MTQCELELLALMVEIAEEDRELYRDLRAEIWRLAKRRHETQSPTERQRWLDGAS